MKLGLVTVLYNSDNVLEDFIKSISLQVYPNYILYLVDNSWNEKSETLLIQLLQKYPCTQFTHINSNGNIGVAAGNNVGIKKALGDKCDAIVLLNNDIVFEQNNVFDELIKSSTKNDRLVVVPKILYYDTNKIWMAGGYMNNFKALGVHYTEKNQNSLQLNKRKDITYAPTCFMYIHASIFQKIGFIDEQYFAYYDDTDFVYRANKARIKILYEPTIIIRHKVSSLGGGDDSLFYIYYSNRNKLYFIKKHYHGMHKLFAFFYTYFSRLFFYLKFNRVQKNKLIQGLKDGIKLKYSNII